MYIIIIIMFQWSSGLRYFPASNCRVLKDSMELKETEEIWDWMYV